MIVPVLPAPADPIPLLRGGDNDVSLLNGSDVRGRISGQLNYSKSRTEKIKYQEFLKQTEISLSPGRSFILCTNSLVNDTMQWETFCRLLTRKVLCNNYQSRNLIGPYRFWVINPGNLTLFTRLFLVGRHARSGHNTSVILHGTLAPKYCQDNVIFCT